MEKLLGPYDKECMRMAMLKHEETFKEQVYELHRLYQIQKTLMKSFQTGSPNRNYLQHQKHPTDYQEYTVAEPDHCNRSMLEAIDESEIELTLGPTRYTARKKHGTPPQTSDSGLSFSSSSTDSSHMNRTTSYTTKQRRREALTGSDMTLMGYENGSKNHVDLEEQFRQERLKQPPWLFQVLSMNMT